MSKDALIEALLTCKPYFGNALCALQGPPERHRYFGAIAEVLSKKKTAGPLAILEVGSWAGASAITWAKALQRLGRDGSITCVDRWQPYFEQKVETAPHYLNMNEAARDGKVLQLFLHNLRAANVSHMVEYHVGDARAVLPTMPSGTFDIIYIDGSHEFSAAQADIREAKRLIREGGIVCGDDLEVERDDVDSDAHRVALDQKRDFVFSSKAAQCYHPGVTEAVALEFGTVSNWEGVWAAMKIGSQWARVDLPALQEIPEHMQTSAVSDNNEVEHLQLVEETPTFNLLQAGKRFMAVAKGLGPVHLFRERIGERELPPVLFCAETLAGARQKALRFEQDCAVPEIKRLQDRGPYNIVQAGQRFIAVAKSLGPVDLFRERVGARELAPVVLEGANLAEVHEKISATAREYVIPAICRLEESEHYNIVQAGQCFVAVAKSLGPVDLFRDRIGERELAPFVFRNDTLAEVREKVSASERERAIPEIGHLLEFSQYNIVQAGRHFIAVAKSLGPVDLFRERIGERELAPLVFHGATLPEVREKIIAAERATFTPKVISVEELDGYNVVHAGNQMLAVAKSLGPVNLFQERIGERDLPPLVYTAPDLQTLQDKIAAQNESQVSKTEAS